MAGGKVTGSHSTVIDAARKVVMVAQGDGNVSKIVLGFVTPRLPVGKHAVKFLPITGGVKVTIRGTNSKQELYIYTQDALATELLIQKLF